ncbi:MAG: nucleoside-diphosphate sugar epimerase/dehydratase [bacterium]
MKSLLNVLFSISTKLKISILVCLDFIFNSFSFFLSFTLLQGLFLFSSFQHFLIIMALSALIKSSFYAYFRVYHFLWRYASVKEFLSLLKSSLLSSLVLGCFLLAWSKGAVPVPVLLLDFFITLSLTGYLRVFMRLIRDFNRKWGSKTKRKRVLILGAGEIGSRIAREITQFYLNDYDIIGFLDDDPNKLKQLIYHKKILGTLNDLESVCQTFLPNELIIALPSISRSRFQEVVHSCQSTGVAFRSTPGLSALIESKGITNQLKEVELDDLLLRSEIKMDLEHTRSFYSGKRILVTGAAGSIGSEICRQLYKYLNCDIILLDHNENALFELTQELSSKPNKTISFIVADIKDRARLEHIFKIYQPHILLHAAAHKHVPLMEQHPYEAIQNNILGTQHLIELSIQFKLSHFLLISTDKAVRPSSCMGASKRACEMLLQIYSEHNSVCKFFAVRFGNVLGSNGSVIPLFKKQIKHGGPLTVTSPEMTRYFMTIPEAVSLVLQTGPIAKGRDIFILDMGKPVKIIDLAKQIISLSGLILDKDIEIKIIGPRPGEKLHEELYFDSKLCKKTVISKIFVKQHFPFDLDLAQTSIQQLITQPVSTSSLALKQQLFDIVNHCTPLAKTGFLSSIQLKTDA